MADLSDIYDRLGDVETEQATTNVEIKNLTKTIDANTREQKETNKLHKDALFGVDNRNGISVDVIKLKETEASRKWLLRVTWVAMFATFMTWVVGLFVGG